MNSRNFNPQQYERYLSPFGKKVLGNLIKILQERDDCNKCIVRNLYNNSQKKCVLNFSDDHVSASPNLCQQNIYGNESRINNHDSNDTTVPSDVIEFPVKTLSNGLLQDAAEDAMSENINKKCVRSVNDTKYFLETLSTTESSSAVTSAIFNGVQTETRDHIEWDDIFDTKLLDDLSILDTENDVRTQKDVLDFNRNISKKVGAECKIDLSYNKLHTNSDTFDLRTDVNSDRGKNIKINVPTAEDILNLPIQSISEERTKNGDSSAFQKTNDAYNNCFVESKTIKNTNFKESKLKRQNSANIIDIIPKKVKKPEVGLKSSFRKQKFTKAVKTWLHEVDNEIFEDVIEFKTNQDKEPKKCEQKILHNKAGRNIVQAQLTNKGGVMKYGMPISKDILEKPKDTNILSKSNVSVTNNTLKDKKTKPKFIPPIRSQIPVKDISYHIVCCNDDNFKDSSIEVKDEAIDMILVFSNGFCQLNSHYTEDTCQVEGVMFQINNVIYYCKGASKSFCSTMEMLLKDNTIVCYDGKNLLKYFASQYDVDIQNTKINVLDVQIGANLIDPDNTLDNFSDVQKMLSFVPEYTIATECIQQKSAWYLTLLRECFLKLKTLLIDYDLWKMFVEIEMRVLPIIAAMEQRGVRVDTERLKCMEDTLLTRLKATEQACHQAAGRAFQINSTVQVRSILYDELQLDSKSNVRIKETVCKGEKSTSESMLRSLLSVHPLPKLILEYRHLHKAHATFLSGIANQVKEGVVKPTWVQTAAATGRIACNNPNLQAIPKVPFSLVLFPPAGENVEDSAESHQILNFRSIYVPREEYMLLAADFKHIECRVFAYAAADTSLLDALSSPDLFRVLAARWLNKSAAEVSSADRERTKRIVYASLYGAGTRRLMEILGVSYDQTLSIMASFNRTFPSLKSFGRGVVERCARLGGRLATLCGRGRHFANIASEDFALRSHAERQAVNFIVQGSAADLCKLAMCSAEARLRAAPPVRARLLLQIHDELVWEVARCDLARAAVEIRTAMEGVGQECGVAVALPVAISVGPTWGHMEEYAPAPSL